MNALTTVNLNILDVWVLVWADNVAVFQPDDIWQRVSDGFDSQFNQSSLLHADVPQLLNELGTHQGFLSWKKKSQETLKPSSVHRCPLLNGSNSVHRV